MREPTIVVVDDNPDHLELISMALEGSCPSEEVLTFGEGAQALDYLLARGPHAGRDTTVQPRLVILDLKMVRMDGLEVLRTLRNHPRTAGVPVVVHSSSVEKEDVARSYAAGASGYVRKATSFDELRQRMRALCEQWLAPGAAAATPGPTPAPAA